MKNVMVVGAGFMGAGIAQVCAQAGYSVCLTDVDKGVLRTALENIRWSIGKFIEKGVLRESEEEIMARIRPVERFVQYDGIDFVIEAVYEDLDLKKNVLSRISRSCPDWTVLASNTSSIPITKLGSAVKKPEKIIGCHFFSPVPRSKVVEVVKGEKTSDETVETASVFCRSLGKEVVLINKDVAGFALGRINHASTVEAIRLVEMGVIGIEDVDKGMKLGFGRPMGPFETLDMVGLEISHKAMLTIYEETGDEKFRPPELLKRKVKEGHLGRKTGKGWYVYDRGGKRIGSAED